MTTDIYKFINKNIFNSIGRINSLASKKEWWIKKGIEKEWDLFIEKTNFLIPNSKNILKQRVYCLANDIKELPRCYCGNPLTFSLPLKTYHEYCSVKCQGNSPKVKNNREKTCIKKFGSKSPLENNEVLSKIKKTNQKKYGVDFHTQKNIPKSSLELIENREWLQNQHHNLKKSAIEISNILGYKNNTEVLKRLHKFGIEIKNYAVSSFENEIYEWLKLNYDGEIIRNSRKIISPKELDFYLPKEKLAIEFDGIFWHNDKRVSKNYHIEKTKECEKKGIQLLHIFENEWNNKKDIWKSILETKLGKSKRIFARKCKIIYLDTEKKNRFLNKNHLQGSCVSKINIGLEYHGELISVMTFGKSRFSEKYDWEIIRFANKIGMSVVGGASKILKEFKKYNKGSIITYADKRYSNGNLYEKLGFNFSHESSPNYFYFNSDNILYSRNKFQKHKLKNVLNIFNSDKTEYQNMIDNGYMRIWDCGNLSFRSL